MKVIIFRRAQSVNLESFQLVSDFSVQRGLIRSKGDPHPLEGPPTWWQWKVYARLGSASLLLWQGESWILNMPLLCGACMTCLCPLGVRMRFQQKPLKRFASGGPAH